MAAAAGEDEIMRSAREMGFAVTVLFALLGAGRAAASHIETPYCDTGISDDESLGPTAFPRGDVFCSTIADPKGEGTFATYVHGTTTSSFGGDIGSVGIGDRLGIFRYNGPRIGEGFQIGLSANVFAQFDLDKPSMDLVNADYVVGIPITMRRGPVSARLRVYHQSSHLGDEFVLDTPIQRVNLSYESAEALPSLDLGPMRVYGGGEYIFARDPSSLKPRLLHGGVELRQGAGVAPTASHAPIRLVAALDVKSAEESRWAMAWSARAGFEVGRPAGREDRSRRWSLLGEYYAGPSPYGQFLREHVSYYGVGLHLGI